MIRETELISSLQFSAVDMWAILVISGLLIANPGVALDQINPRLEIVRALNQPEFKHVLHESFWETINSLQTKLNYLNATVSPDVIDDWTKCALGITDILGSFVSGRSTSDDLFSALSILDSDTKLPSGILKGNIMDLGQYDECVAINREQVQVFIPQTETYFNTSYLGHHCLIGLTFIYPPSMLSKPSVVNKVHRNLSDHEWVPNSITLTFAQCYPSTCKPKMVEDIWSQILIGPNKLLSKLGISVYPTVQPKDCHTSERAPPDGLDWAVLVIVIFFVTLGAICSLLDKYHLKKKLQGRRPTTAEQAVISFSVFTNGSKLFSTKQNASQMNCINGMKFFSICWVIVGHHYGYMVRSPVVNFLDLPIAVTQWHKMMLVNAILSVDTFFFISGLLNTYVFFNGMDRRQKYNIFTVLMGYLHRYIRLTPSYLMMIGITATWLYRIGDGPLWDRYVGYEKNNCRVHWWSDLLYLNNYLNPAINCMMQSWYLAADTQMFWASPLLLYPMYRWPKIGLINLGLATIASLIIPFVVSYHYEIKTPLPISQDPVRYELEFDVLYLPTHTKTIAYVCGIFMGYIVQKIKSGKINFKLNYVKATIGWVIGLTCLLYGLFGCYPLFQQDQPYNQLQTSLYLGSYRLWWSIGVGWIIFACISGYGGIVNWILSLKPFGPLGRLSYCIYLTHITVVIYMVATTRTPIYYSDYNIVMPYLGEVMIICVVATVLSLLLEAPIMGLEKIIFGTGGGGGAKKERPNQQEHPRSA